MLVRLQNTFALAVNSNISLPKYMLVILDEDLIEFLGYREAGMSQMLGRWIHWLIKELEEVISLRKKQLPVRAQKDAEPCTYWSLAPLHCNFTDKTNETRRKLNFCLESLLKGKPRMRLIKIKEIWDFNDKSLVKNNCIMESGFYTYWRAVDAAFKFNACRHEIYLAKMKANQKLSATNNDHGSNDTSNEDKKTTTNVKSNNEVAQEDHGNYSTNQRYSMDDIPQFFQRHRHQTDCFHWNRLGHFNQAHRQHQLHQGNRFFLPRPRWR